MSRKERAVATAFHMSYPKIVIQFRIYIMHFVVAAVIHAPPSRYRKKIPSARSTHMRNLFKNATDSAANEAFFKQVSMPYAFAPIERRIR